MVPNMKGTGRTISKTDTESKHGRMGVSTKGSTSRDENMVKGAINGLIKASTLANGSPIE